MRHLALGLGRVDIDVPTLDDIVVLTGRMKQFACKSETTLGQ